ncbi:hypothetical protein U0070_011136 [Myodes glareolus]|uniref:Uncharacterized protein n=1 Tax=Myodes glareolus TaxID=447135 RepID=A0AAW0IB42_MYOGA
MSLPQGALVRPESSAAGVGYGSDAVSSEVLTRLQLECASFLLHVWLKYERTAIFNCHSSKASLLLATGAKLRNPRQLVVKQQEQGLWVVVSMF